ncbi:MAG: formate dehydrogenase subunit gamma [Betaproteobacteria bacterium]|nr:formate dehydrogenase subunit gamma [Betaproteobacteria bacterium]
MIRDPQDLRRYTASQRVNHWIVGMCFILLAFSGLAFFHPAFFPLAMLFGGGVWARILHPLIGVAMAVFFTLLALRFWRLNMMTATDLEWLKRAREMMDGDDHNMPIQGKYNGGQKALFWAVLVCVLVLFVSGLAIWREYFSALLPIGLVRFASLLHAVFASLMIALITVHVYAAIWVKGTIRAMWYGTVTRAWAKQHHAAWYREMTGRKS